MIGSTIARSQRSAWCISRNADVMCAYIMEDVPWINPARAAGRAPAERPCPGQPYSPGAAQDIAEEKKLAKQQHEAAEAQVAPAPVQTATPSNMCLMRLA